MLRLNAIQLLSLLLFPTTAFAINGCPAADTVYTGTGGVRYRICPDTDLEGPSTQITPNVASATACAQLCDRTMDCFKAVYDTQDKNCHFKAFTGLNWVTNTRFDVIQSEQINIAKCPNGESMYTNNGVSIIPQYVILEKIQMLRHR